MICSRCHKRPAVVFVASSAPDSEPQGYCLVCAKELGMKPMTDLMDKMGIDEEQLEAMQEQLDGLMALEEDPNGISVDDEEEGFSAGLRLCISQNGERHRKEAGGGPGDGDRGRGIHADGAYGLYNHPQ